MSKTALRRVLATIFCLTVMTLDGRSQTFQAQISGAVMDQTGAILPGAELTAKNLATGSVYSAISNDSGIYRFASLPPAQYSVSCTLRGFKHFETGPVTLQVNQVLEVNVTLQPGQVTEQITVSAAPPILDTETSSIGTIVTTRSIQNLPLNVRDPLALISLTPGVVIGPNFGNGGGNDVGRNFFKSDFNVGAGRSGSQEILLDGAPDTTPDINRGIIDPPVDSVQHAQPESFARRSARVQSAGSKLRRAIWADFRRSYQRNHEIRDKRLPRGGL